MEDTILVYHLRNLITHRAKDLRHGIYRFGMDENVDLRKIVFSSDDFWGYTVTIDIKRYFSIHDIEGICTASLLQVLTDYNFENLLERAQKKEFHIHDATFPQLRARDPLAVIYICDHGD